MNSFLRILKEYLRWLWQGKFHILSVLAVIITIGYVFGIVDWYPKSVSAVATVGGILIIFLQLRDDAIKFADRQPNTPVNWLRNRPELEPKVLTVQPAEMVMTGENVKLRLSIKKDATIEQKVDFLLRQNEHIQTVMDHVGERIDELAASSMQTSKQLGLKIEDHDNKLKTLMAGHAVGAYDLSLFGIVITLCGTIIQVSRV